MTGHLLSKNGKIKKEQKILFNEKNAEKVASNIYEQFMINMPWDIYGFLEQDGSISFSLGTKNFFLPPL